MKIISKNKVKKVDEMFFKNLKKGDSKTLQSFYDIYASSIYTTILRYVNHIPDAEDLLQESLLKIIIVFEDPISDHSPFFRSHIRGIDRFFEWMNGNFAFQKIHLRNSLENRGEIKRNQTSGFIIFFHPDGSAGVDE